MGGGKAPDSEELLCFIEAFSGGEAVGGGEESVLVARDEGIGSGNGGWVQGLSGGALGLWEAPGFVAHGQAQRGIGGLVSRPHCQSGAGI